MKYVAVTLIAGALAYAGLTILKPSSAGAAETTGSWTTFDKGVQQARSEHRKILVDFYTDWCSWCKKMDQEVYADGRVQRLLGSKFVAVKLNAESNDVLFFQGKQYTNRAFTQAMGITGYPSIVFFDDQAKPITILPGYVDAGRFADILTYIGDNHYQTTSFEQFLSGAASKR